MIFFNRYKKVMFAFLIVLLMVYTAFLFVLPNVINLNNYKEDIKKIVTDTCKLNIDADDIRIVTSWDLKAGIKIQDFSLSYPDKKKIVSAKDAQIRISVLPLVFKTLRISDVSVTSPDLNLVYTVDKNLDIVKYFENNMKDSETSSDSAIAFPLNISDKLPDVSLKNYNVKLQDESTKNSINIKGENFTFDKAVINKHFRVLANGAFLINEKENIKYNIKTYSFWPVMSQNSDKTDVSAIPQIDFIKELVKYNPKADINADIEFKKHAGHIDVFGDLNIDKISINLDGEKLPDSYFHLNSSGHNTNIDSNFYVSRNEKADFKAQISHGHKTKADLNLKTDKISFVSIQKFITAILNSLNIENDIAMFDLKGFMNADFSVKTDLKTFESSGFFKVFDGKVTHKKIPLNIRNVAADIDFSNNSMNIKQAGAIINNSSIEVKGTIDSKADADVSVLSGDIQIAPLFNAFAPAEIRKAYILDNGKLKINILIKGSLKDIEPNINIDLEKLLLKDRMNSFVVSNESSIVNIKTKGTSFSGDINIKDSSIKMPAAKINFNIPAIDISVTPDDINIVPFSALLNSSKINISGSIKNYMKKMDIDIPIKGSISSADIKKLLPPEMQGFVSAKGSIPVATKITGNDKKIELIAQAHSDSGNHFTPLAIKKMIGKPGLVNVSLIYENDKLNIEDASLYLANKVTLADNFSYNKKGAVKIAGLSGSISDLSSYPSLRILFSVPEQLQVSSSVLPNASLKAKGEVNITGNTQKPYFRGFFTIKDTNLSDFLTKIQDMDFEFNGDIITAKIQNLNINGTSFNVDAQASSKLADVLLVKKMTLTCSEFYTDKLFEAMNAMNKVMASSSSSASTVNTGKGPVVPVKISDGTIDIQKFKMKQAGGDFVASNITGDFSLINDLFKLKNLKASVYGGEVTGDVSYNLATTAVSAVIKGKNVNANNAVTVFAALKDQVIGNVDFDANVKLKGSTYEQQIKSLNGKINFSLKDGQLGSLGRFETFLKADNLLTESFISTKIGSLVSTVAPYNTGKFSYLTGNLDIVNGIAELNPVKMSGPNMSLLLTGNVNILTMISSIQILGSLAPDIVSALGPVANLSVEKFASYIPKFGASIASALNTYNAAANKNELESIPELTPAKEGSQSFKVILNGNLNNPASAVKRFQWLNTAEKIEQEEQSLLQSVTPAVSVPQNKEELKQQVKESIQNTLENNEKVQELKQNKAVQTFSSIYNFYKNSKNKNTQTEESTNP